MSQPETVHRGPIAVRAYAPRRERKPWRRPEVPDTGYVLVLDCETTTDASQRLLFGGYRVLQGERLIQEGIFHADDLAEADIDTLQHYVDAHPADHGQALRLMSRSEFGEEVLWKVGYEARALIVGHNIGFDLSRLAVRCTTARRGGFSLRLWQSVDDDGRVWRHKFRPDITVKSLGSKRQFIRFTAPQHVDAENKVDGGGSYPGRFLDTHMAAFALSDRSLSLDAAAALFGLQERKADPGGYGRVTEQHIGYLRQDCRLTFELYLALAKEWSKHPVDPKLEELYSPASVGKAYFGAMGITPPLERAPDVSDEELGHHMVAYFGGRTECRVRGVPLPVRVCDVVSEYATVFVLSGLWRYVIAERLECADATAHARTLLAHATRERLLDPAAWPELATVVCRVHPVGELLPARAKYGARVGDDGGVAWTIGLSHLHADDELWVTLAGLCAARILDGRAPEILEATRIMPRGVLPDLRPVALRGSVTVDPASDDFFWRVINERQRIKGQSPSGERDRLERALKTLSSSTSYGISAEFRTLEAKRGGERVVVHGLDRLECRVQSPEEAGLYCFPPFAATITGLGRLMLALLQAGVEARGGTYVGCDTDGMLIVASPTGGLVPCPGGPHRTPDGREAVLALSDAQLHEVLDELNALNPYDSDVVPSIVKVEDENYRLRDDGTVDKSALVEVRALQLSSKRYADYERTPTRIRLRKTSRHGLGMYRPPPGETRESWVDYVWECFIREAEGLPPLPEPEWLDLPAVSQMTVSTPHVLAPFRHMNEGEPYADQVKPYNFMLVGHRDPDPTVLGPEGPNIDGVVPIAPYTTDPEGLMNLQWLDRATGEPIAVTTKPGGQLGHVRLMTYRDVIDAHRRHPEHKAGDPGGGPGTSVSVGLLPRLTVYATPTERSEAVVHIGKESNRLDEEEAGLLEERDSPTAEYRDPKREWRLQAERLEALRKEMGAKEFARRVGLPERTIRYALHEAGLSRAETRARLRRAVRSYCWD